MTSLKARLSRSRREGVPGGLLVRAWVMLLVYRCLVPWGAPRLIKHGLRQAPEPHADHTPEHCARALALAAAFVPGAACLSQALALRHLLALAGYASELHVGVRKEDEALLAHAWVTYQGAPLSDPGAIPYTPLAGAALRRSP